MMLKKAQHGMAYLSYIVQHWEALMMFDRYF
jgi:hypothetical protein